jgi:hypothetical protein
MRGVPPPAWLDKPRLTIEPKLVTTLIARGLRPLRRGRGYFSLFGNCSNFFRCFFDSIISVDFHAFFGDFNSPNEAQNHQKTYFLQLLGVFVFKSYFGGYFGCFVHAKPFKTTVKTMVLKLFRFFEKVVKSTQKLLQNTSKITKINEKHPPEIMLIFVSVFFPFFF